MRVRVMAEINMWPTWVKEGVDPEENMDPRDMRLSPDLTTALIEWSDAFDATYDPQYPPDSAFQSPDEERNWQLSGQELSRRLASELGPEAHVVYHAAGELDIIIQ